METAMASDTFGEAVVASLDRILHSDLEIARLNLARDIVNGLRGFFAQRSCRNDRACSQSRG